MLFHFKRGMAKIQILLALTFDGFLPRSHETLMRWVEGNTRHGFPLWQAKASFSIYPHYGLIDLLDVADKHDGECIYLAEIRDKDSAEYAGGLLRYNLVDEIVLYCCLSHTAREYPSRKVFSPAGGSSMPTKVFPTAFAAWYIGEKDKPVTSVRTYPSFYTG